MQWLSLVFMTAALLPTGLLGQTSVTTRTHFVSGPNTLSSEVAAGAVLSDGSEAGAILTYSYSWTGVQGTLTLVAENTSPVVSGVPNPLITGIYLALPAGAVSSATLVSQSASAGQPPDFDLALDTDLQAMPNLLRGGRTKRFLFICGRGSLICHPHFDTF